MEKEPIIEHNNDMTTTTRPNPLINKPEEPQQHKQIEMDYNNVSRLLEEEKQRNKNEVWTKLDKTLKNQKLQAYAEKYGKEHNFSTKEIKNLKLYFSTILEMGKLQKTKDVMYDKETRRIVNIPSLVYDNVTHNFTLKSQDHKRISTLKSLTPKRTTLRETILSTDDDHSSSQLEDNELKDKN